MVEVINSSFIPKKEFKKKTDKSKRSRINVFFLISLVVFLVTIISSIGVYLWKEDLKVEIKKFEYSFSKDSERYNIGTIKELLEIENRINISRELLLKHYNILPIFTYLERNTLKDVLFTSFYLEERENEIFVSLEGRAPDLTDLQLQSRNFSRNPNVENLILHNITKSREGFSVFDMEFTVDKKFLTERNFLLTN